MDGFWPWTPCKIGHSDTHPILINVVCAEICNSVGESVVEVIAEMVVWSQYQRFVPGADIGRVVVRIMATEACPPDQPRNGDWTADVATND